MKLEKNLLTFDLEITKQDHVQCLIFVENLGFPIF